MTSDPNHVEIFRRGPKAWNAWREQNPATLPELTGIALKLSERQMGPANGGPINLKAACLQDAFLRFATLSASNLKVADLSGADLVHARFDDADLSGANLSNAKLDHADFSGANLRNVDFSGASLCHAKNLTRAQLEASILSDSTILPADLQGFVSSWSARRQTNTNAIPKLRELGPEARQADVVVEISSPKHRVWKAGILFLVGASIITGFVWSHMNEAERPTSDAQSETTPSLTEPKPSPDTEGQNLQPSPHQAVLEKNLDPEHPPSAEVAVPSITPSAITVDGIEGRPEQRPLYGTDGEAQVPQETNDQPPRASDAVNLLEEASAPNEPAHTPPEEDYGPGNSQASEAASAAPAIASAPELPTEASDLPVTGSVEPAAVTHGDPVVPGPTLEAPVSSALATTAPAKPSRHGTVPDSPAAPALPDAPSISMTEPPAPTLGLNTPIPPSLSVAVTPSPPKSAVPLSEEKGVQIDLPPDVAPIPMPVRKPVIETSVPNSEAEFFPTPGRDSVAHPDRSRLAKGLSLPRSRSRVCVPVIGRYYEGKCSYQ